MSADSQTILHTDLRDLRRDVKYINDSLVRIETKLSTLPTSSEIDLKIKNALSLHQKGCPYIRKLPKPVNWSKILKIIGGIIALALSILGAKYGI